MHDVQGFWLCTYIACAFSPFEKLIRILRRSACF